MEKFNLNSKLQKKLQWGKNKSFSNSSKSVQITAFVCKGDACSKKTYNVEFDIKKGDESNSKLEYSLKVEF